MIGRFEGAGGRDNLITVLMEQRLVQNDVAVATEVADHGEVVAFQPGESLIQQDGAETDLFFVLVGNVDIHVNDRHVATRGVRESVGEMAIIDPAAPRSATVKAGNALVALRVSGAEFVAIADRHPLIWRTAAKVVAERLRERERFHRRLNVQPVLFIGSSTEGLEVARSIQNEFKHERVDVRPWFGTGVFGASHVPIEELVRLVEEVDFAIMVFGPDDSVASRGEEYQAPRDNVIFEMGLFMGRLGRERVFMVKEQSTDLKIPSDLTGVLPLTYVSRLGSKISEQIGPLCNELRRIIGSLGSL